MSSAEVRKALRLRSEPWRDTGRIHELGRAYGREKAHLAARPPRGAARSDLLWGPDGASYKVVTRSLSRTGRSASIEVPVTTETDFLLIVVIDRRTLRLREMARVAWTMVEWIGTRHGSRWRLRWSEDSPLRGVAELL